ncbi:MAG: aminopeptidase P family N-terminal domain-containing protein, partial [Candidatus Omnitrophica bacterium]|nr:aminopeptidase P family N-terminal domain-containing protein [Candidatus Omnitrophota bacterium]
MAIKSIYAQLEAANIDGLLISLPANISYLTEINSRDAYLLVSKKENIYFADSRYTQELKKNLNQAFTLEKINGSVFKLIADTFGRLGLK